MYIKLYSLVIILATLYTSYFIVIKHLLKKFTLKEILVNAYIISAFIVLILFKNELFTSIKKFNLNYIFLLLLALIMVLCNSFEIIAVNSNINIGIIESLATSIYLPIVALISFYFYKTKLSVLNLFGIILIAIGSCFVMRT